MDHADIKRGPGRPRLYDTPDQFDAAVLAYQAYCLEMKEPVTWTGLALFLGFSSRQAIDTYEGYDGFYDSVKRAKTFVEHEYEKKMAAGGGAGPIFALKNFGWRDRQELELDGSDTFLAALRETTRKVMVDGNGE